MQITRTSLSIRRRVTCTFISFAVHRLQRSIVHRNAPLSSCRHRKSRGFKQLVLPSQRQRRLLCLFVRLVSTNVRSGNRFGLVSRVREFENVLVAIHWPCRTTALRLGGEIVRAAPPSLYTMESMCAYSFLCVFFSFVPPTCLDSKAINCNFQTVMKNNNTWLRLPWVLVSPGACLKSVRFFQRTPDGFRGDPDRPTDRLSCMIYALRLPFSERRYDNISTTTGRRLG